MFTLNFEAWKPFWFSVILVSCLLIEFFLNYEVICVQKGQLGHGDLIQRDRPTIVSGLSKYVTIFDGGFIHWTLEV